MTERGELPITTVPCPGTFQLYSRIVRLDTGTSRRDIIIVEMTETQIESLRRGRWSFGAFGLIIGMIIISAYTFIYTP